MYGTRNNLLCAEPRAEGHRPPMWPRPPAPGLVAGRSGSLAAGPSGKGARWDADRTWLQNRNNIINRKFINIQFF